MNEKLRAPVTGSPPKTRSQAWPCSAGKTIAADAGTPTRLEANRATATARDRARVSGWLTVIISAARKTSATNGAVDVIACSAVTCAVAATAAGQR
jgi:hypothetical protein